MEHPFASRCRIARLRNPVSRLLRLAPLAALLTGWCAPRLEAVAATEPSAPAAQPAPAADSAALAAMLADYYAEFRALYPLDTLENGDNSHVASGKWQDELKPGWRAQVEGFCRKYLAALQRFDRARLSGPDRTNYDALRWLLETRLQDLATDWHLLAVRQLGSPHLTFAQMASGDYLHRFETAADFDAFLERAHGFDGWVTHAIDAMREGMRRGIVQPRVLVERILPQLAPLAADDRERNVLFRPLGRLPAALPEPARAALAVRYEAGVHGMRRSYARLHAFLRDEYLAAARDTHGLGAQPGGAELYAFLVRKMTTTDLTPDAVHALGLAEVARIRGEMEAVRREVKFEGGLRAFLDHLQTDPKLRPYRHAEEVLAAYRAIEARVMAGIPRLFKRVPRSKFEIRQTEPFRAASASAEYVVGTADGSRPGVFYVPIPDPTAVRTLTMEALFLHEAIPGHHFDVALGIEDATLPAFRRFDFVTAYTEGWGLYAESLAPELGLARDPYVRLGYLDYEMMRAVRLVVDTGLHAKGWTREQAMEYAAEQMGGAPIAQSGAIERYMAWPGQALAYKIGQLKIRELRRRAEAELGPKFDVREFHDQVVGLGAMPLAVLEAKVEEWIRAAR